MQGTLALANGPGQRNIRAEETEAASNVAEKKMRVCGWNARTGTLNKNDGCGICVDVIQHLTRGQVDRVLAQYLHLTAIDGGECG